MNPIAEIELLSESAAGRYGVFTMALIGVLSRHLDDDFATAPSTRTHMHLEALGVAQSFLSGEYEVLSANTSRIAHTALQGLENTQELQDAVKFAIDSAMAGIQSQSHRDIDTARIIMAKMAIEVAMLARRRGWEKSAALIAVRSRKKDELPKFSFMDRSGRRWGSDRYVKTLLRSHYLDTYNETAMYAISLSGGNIGVIKSSKPNLNGTRFRISNDGPSDLPLYLDLKRDVFHPNSDAVVTFER